MDQQAKVVERNGAPKTASQGLAGNVGAFANDVLTLTELQSQLLVADVRECSRRAWFPVWSCSVVWHSVWRVFPSLW